METYARHIVAEQWPRRGEPAEAAALRPVASFHTLRDAVANADRRNAQARADGLDGLFFQVWDLEHLHLGNMLTAADCAETVARFRQEAA
jgi:hypothetical protein